MLYRKFCLVLLSSIPLVSSLTIRCHICLEYGPEQYCDYAAKNGTCFELIASKQFATFKKAKPTLEQPEQNTGYQCFEFKMTDSDPYEKGCTYENLDVCAELPESVHCYTCKQNYCNSLKAKNSGIISRDLSIWIAILGLLSILY